MNGTAPGVELFLFGCSHAGRLQKGAQSIGLDVAGGGLMRGRLWDEGRFDWSDDGVLTLHDPVAAERFAAALKAAGVARLTDLEVPVVTTLGFQFDIALDHMNGRYTVDACGPAAGDTRDFLPPDVVEAYVRERRAGMIGLVADLVARGLTVVAVTPPPRHPAVALAAAFEDVAAAALEAAGAEVHRTRAWAADGSGLLAPEFAAKKDGDRVHGNSYFGAHAMARVADRLGLSPSALNLAPLASPDAFELHVARLRRGDRLNATFSPPASETSR